MNNKYEVLGIVGEGAYGIVYKCRNKETKEIVAIKKFKEIEDEIVKKTMKRELKVLQILKHENVVEFKEAFRRKNNLFIVFEFVEQTLLELLEEQPQGLDPRDIKNYIYQLCKAVKYLHDQNIIHRDIKPENLLIKDKSILKVIDFGFARKINNKNEELTDYVATRWYRAPELLITNGYYGFEVDYWAIGCIMGELADGNPLFPGENETDQLHCIQKVLGNLPSYQVELFYKNQIFAGKKLLDVQKPETLEKRYMGKLPKIAINFMKGLLELNPKKRLCGEKVFQHKYFSGFNDNIYNINNSAQNTLNNAQEIKEANSIKIFDEKSSSMLNKNYSDKNIINIFNNNISTNNKDSNEQRMEKDIAENNKNILNKNSHNLSNANTTTNINIINFNNFNNIIKNSNNNFNIKKINLNNSSSNNATFKNLNFPVKPVNLSLEKVKKNKINPMAMTMTNKFPLSLQNKFSKNSQLANVIPRKSYEGNSNSKEKEKNIEDLFKNSSKINNLSVIKNPQQMIMGFKTFYNKNDNIYNYNINLNFNSLYNNKMKTIHKNSQKTSIIEEEEEDDFKINNKKSKSLNHKVNKVIENNNNSVYYNINNNQNCSNYNDGGSPLKEKNKYSLYYSNSKNNTSLKKTNYGYKIGNSNNNNNNNYYKGYYGGNNMANISCYNGFSFRNKNNNLSVYNGNNNCILPSLKNSNNLNGGYNNNFKKFYQMINK